MATADDFIAAEASTIAVDFDGVIHDTASGCTPGVIDGGLIPGAVDALRSLMNRYAVYIHTCRDPNDVAPWLSSHVEWEVWGMWAPPPVWRQRNVLLVTTQKLPALAYIDDRGVRFTGDWATTLTKLIPLLSEEATGD